MEVGALPLPALARRVGVCFEDAVLALRGAVWVCAFDMEEYSCFGGGCAEVCLNYVGESLPPYGAFYLGGGGYFMIWKGVFG